MSPRPATSYGAESREPTITKQQYQRTRDSVIAGLTNLQSAITELIHAYLAHTNSVIAGSGAVVDSLAISNPLSLASSFPAAAAAAAAPVAAAVAVNTNGQSSDAPTEVLDEKTGRRKRKVRRPKDPNAPKRPLTAYFLYARYARDVVRCDLEAQPGRKGDVKPGDVAAESTRRWHDMAPDAREKWKSLYKEHFNAYLEEVRRYRQSIAGGAAALDGAPPLPLTAVLPTEREDEGALRAVHGHNGDRDDDDDDDDESVDVDGDEDEVERQVLRHLAADNARLLSTQIAPPAASSTIRRGSSGHLSPPKQKRARKNSVAAAAAAATAAAGAGDAYGSSGLTAGHHTPAAKASSPAARLGRETTVPLPGAGFDGTQRREEPDTDKNRPRAGEKRKKNESKEESPMEGRKKKHRSRAELPEKGPDGPEVAPDLVRRSDDRDLELKDREPEREKEKEKKSRKRRSEANRV